MCVCVFRCLIKWVSFVPFRQPHCSRTRSIESIATGSSLCRFSFSLFASSEQNDFFLFIFNHIFNLNFRKVLRNFRAVLMTIRNVHLCDSAGFEYGYCNMVTINNLKLIRKESNFFSFTLLFLIFYYIFNVLHFRSNIFQLMWWKQSRSVFFIVNSKHPDFQVNQFHFFQSHFILKLIYPNVLNILYVCLSGWLHLSKYAPWQIESSKISFRFVHSLHFVYVNRFQVHVDMYLFQRKGYNKL